VQLTPSSPTSEVELTHHAARHLAPYKRPWQILLVPSIPLTPAGKVIKGELAKMSPTDPRTLTTLRAARLST
jgi:acyl-CoA synthetase (AMP-forming)/AMP-acid ligase II